MPHPQSADIPTLVRHLQGGSVAHQVLAAQALLRAHQSGAGGSKDAVAAAIAAGGIPPLLQLVGGPKRHPGAEQAAWLLSVLSCGSGARCQAIVAADGVTLLLRCLDSDSRAAVQAGAASTLANIAARPGKPGAAVAAASLPVALRRLGSSDDGVLEHTARLLANMGATLPEQRYAIAAAGGIPPLVRLLRRPSAAVAAQAAAALSNLARSRDGIAAIAEAGGIPPLVDLLASSDDADAAEAAAGALRRMLSSPGIAAQATEAGGVAAAQRCLQCHQFSSETHELARACLGILAPSGGGWLIWLRDNAVGPVALGFLIRQISLTEVALVLSMFYVLERMASLAGALWRAGRRSRRLRSPRGRWALGCALLLLALSRPRAVAASVYALGSSLASSVASLARVLWGKRLTLLLAITLRCGLMWLNSYTSRDDDAGPDPASAAPRHAPAASAAAAPAEPSPPPPRSASRPAAPAACVAADEPVPRPPRVCAAPGCGSTAGLRRCAGCGSVRFCSEACMRAHWKDHRPECKRLRAAAAADSSSEQQQRRQRSGSAAASA